MRIRFRSVLSLLFLVLLSTGGLALHESVDLHETMAAGVITTVVGNGTAGDGGDGGPATSAHLKGPMGVAFDAAGNLYIADRFNNRIRKVTPNGVISTVAGNGTEGFSGDGGPATSAQLYHPEGMVLDTSGNLYVADFNNNRIRKVTATGEISTVAGTDTSGFSGDGGPATDAQLFTPSDVKIDAGGNLFIADSYNHRIRKVTPDGVINTVAGNGTDGFSGDGGSATSAQLNYPWGVALDAAGNLYIADSNNHRIRKVTPAGIISTVAGTGIPGFSGDGGPATSAQLYYSNGVLLDAAGNLYIVEHQHRIRKVTPAGVINTIAGNGTQGFSGDGGPATSAQLNHPNDAALDAAGNLYVADTDNNRIRRVEGVGSGSGTANFFPQVAVGGGYTTIFTIGNSGSGTGLSSA